MLKKYSYLLTISILFIFTALAHAGIEPLSPMDVKYLYPVKSIMINGSRLAYIDEGKGQPVVFVHGVSATLASFDVLYPALIKKGYRVIAVDLLGYGKSDKPDIAYNVPFHAQTVISFIRQLGLKNVFLVGHSMGGAISAFMTIKEPELIKSTILLAPAGLTEYSSLKIFLFKVFYNRVFGKNFSDPEAAGKYYRDLVYQWSPAMDEYYKTRERVMVHPEWVKVQKTIKGGAVSALEVSKEILPKIGDVKKPVLVLLAADDSLFSSEEVKENIEKRNKNWKIEIFERCGHFIQMDQKEKVIQRILEFIK